MRCLRLMLASTLLVALLAVPGAADVRVELLAGGVVRGALGDASGEPRDAAGAALAEWAEALGVDASAFVFESVRTSLIGIHVRGREMRGGVAVDGTAVAVHLIDGAVRQVEAHAATLAGAPVAVPVGPLVAQRAALRHLGVERAVVAPVAERLLVERDGRLADVYRVSVVALAPVVAATVDVAAGDGRVLAVRDERRFADATATLFDPNPIVSARDASLRQAGPDESGVDADLSNAAIDAELTDLALFGFDPVAAGRGNLVGRWVDVLGAGPYVPVGGRLDMIKTDPRFEGAMAYAHLDRLQRYFQALGFTGDAGVNAEPQTVIALPVLGFDNSFYQPANDLILLGAGGVDDGEDAEVIVHEYGHAVHDAQVPGWGRTAEGGAMGEGFGDFLAAAYYARDISGGFGDACVADWDATSYSSAEPPCLRRTDGTKHYPEDIRRQVHADGELWSAYLWRLRSRLGDDPVEQTDNVLRLLLSSHELLTSDAEFGDAVAALRIAALALGEPEWAQYVDAEARTTGFPLEPS